MTNVFISLFTINEVELTYRKKSEHPEIIITSQEMAAQILRSAWDENKIELLEQFKIVLIDGANACLGVADISSGGLSSCMVDVRLVFATALKAKATQIILAHNHPSGRTTPSDVDLALTKRLCAAGEILDIRVLDHFILTKESHRSLASAGLMP